MLKSLLKTRFIRFLLVGGLNTLFGYGIFALLLWGLPKSAALLGSTILGILFNFKTTGILVFESHNNRLIYRFVLCYAIVYLVNLGLLQAAENLEFNLWLAQAIYILPMAVLAYSLQKSLVFKTTDF